MVKASKTVCLKLYGNALCCIIYLEWSRTIEKFSSLKRNLLLRPDGRKKAYVRLASDYDALDVANKVNNIFYYYNIYTLLRLNNNQKLKLRQ